MPQFYSLAQLSAYAARHGLKPAQAIGRLLEHDIWPEHLRRNYGLISAMSQQKLLELPVFIAGCGGLGGEIAAQLVQLGASRLLLCDYDSFEESNSNRQRYCSFANIGKPKAVVTARALLDKAPWGEFRPIVLELSPQNLPELIAPCSIVIDCLDSVEGKQMLENAAMKAGLPWLHGSVLHHEGFACMQSRADGVLKRLYGQGMSQSGAGSILSHVVSGTASLMLGLFRKWLENPAYSSSLIHIDFSVPECERFDLP